MLTSDQELKSPTSDHADNTQSKDDAMMRRMPKIYTRAGDLGYTNLLGCGDAVPKWNKKIRAYGAVDELNSHLGRVREILDDMPDCSDSKVAHIGTKLVESITGIQQILFVASSWLSRADYKMPNVRPTLNELSYDFVEELEGDIDLMTDVLPPLKNFILLSGSGTSEIHIARSVCRRAESEVADAVYSADAEAYDQYSLTMIYLNRLSDWLFTVARYHLHFTGQDEIIVKPKVSRILPTSGSNTHQI